MKKSRFIAIAAPATDRQGANAVLATVTGEFKDARHHCWAYRLGDPSSTVTAGMSDDGEPAGTAGRPILNMIEYGGVSDIVVVVVRYFGGVKLGAGGLMRAYSTATRQLLDIMPRVERVVCARVRIQCGFSDEHDLRRWLAGNTGSIETVDYAEGIEVISRLPENKLEELRETAAARRWHVHRA